MGKKVGMVRGPVPLLDRQPMLPNTGAGEWFTPDNLFREIEAKFGPFTVDVAADESNSKCPEYFTKQQDGRKQLWLGRVWCNPPYENLIEWVKKADYETKVGRAQIAVLLLPAGTSTEWWHEYAWKRYLDGTAQIHWVRGKRRFGGTKSTTIMGSVAIAFYSLNELKRIREAS